MKALILAAALAAATFPAVAQTNVHIDIGQPGFYGRIDIGDYGRPQVVYAQPVVVERGYRGRAAPVYLRVPPGHRKNWSKHCRKYGACGQPVMFVQDQWYSNVYAPRYRETHGYRDGRGRGHDDRRDGRYDGRRDGRDDGRHDGRGKDRHEGRGHGNGHGNGHSNGRG